MKYNIWHVEMYAGWNDYDNPSDCNIKKNFIMDASYTKEAVMDMLVSLHKEDRVVEIVKCDLIKNGRLFLEDI